MFCIQVPLAFSDIIRNLTLLVSEREDFISFILVFLGMVHFKFKYMFLYKIMGSRPGQIFSLPLSLSHTQTSWLSVQKIELADQVQIHIESVGFILSQMPVRKS